MACPGPCRLSPSHLFEFAPSRASGRQAIMTAGRARPGLSVRAFRVRRLGRDPAQLALSLTKHNRISCHDASASGPRATGGLPSGPPWVKLSSPGRSDCTYQTLRYQCVTSQSEFTGKLKPEFRLNFRVSTATESTVT